MNSVEPDEPKLALKQVQDDPSIYLVPECDTADDMADMLLDFYLEIFDDQLAGWFVNEESWPQDRSFDLFRRWFDVQHYSMLIDLSDGPLIREEY
ncbi:MAG TPA: VacJ [Candidatus Angelobacter sp.]